MSTVTPPPDYVPSSPRWSALTKFLVSLVFVVLAGFFIVRFREMMGPLVFAFILAYLINPLIERITERTRLSWGAAVALVYLVLVLSLVTILIVAGIALEQQIEGMYRYMVTILPALPTRLETLLSNSIALGPFTLDLSRPFYIGPFLIDFSTLELQPLYDQLLAALQPALSRTGNLVGTLASGTLSVLGWILFILIISYYLLHDLKSLMPSIEQVVPAGYAYDVRRLAAELAPIWNAFLRGQITLAIVMGLLVGITMALLGVRYAIVLGLLAGLLEFIPIIGPVIVGTVAFLIALFQPTNYLGLAPIYFALVVVVVSILLQQIENNFLVPRIIGGSLNLHPIVILIGAVIAASLAGIVGLLLSAPLIATLRLFGGYVYRKMFDLDPWPEPPPRPTTQRQWSWPGWIRPPRRAPSAAGPPAALANPKVEPAASRPELPHPKSEESPSSSD